MENLVARKIQREFWKNKKVLITGHTGFKGSWLTKILLKFSSKVYGYSLEAEKNSLFRNLQINSPNLIEKVGDINNLKSLKEFVNYVKPEIVFHLAAQPIVSESYLDPITTFETNCLGTLNLLESLKSLQSECAVVLITTDKVYRNIEEKYSYKEEDILGGQDPYSSSKACMEMLVSSWRESFCGFKKNQTKKLSIATARAGNVIGGGDFASYRLIPDVFRAISNNEKVSIRNPFSTRPWQHVLDPLNGYLLLAESLFDKLKQESKPINTFSRAFNFGPKTNSNKTVNEVLNEIKKHWNFEFDISNNADNFHESKLLNIDSSLAYNLLNWQPIWPFELTLEKTIKWYKNFIEGYDSGRLCEEDINQFFYYS